MTGNSHPRIPSATYRLQFHSGFTFRDAIAILDYLESLGISDIYSSPYFQASPTSTHGYDVSDHNRINPAIGGQSDFRAFSSELRRRGMGQVLDFVPNHMGIGASLNYWWMDVLEDGIASPFAHYFDIDWHPRKEALADRVLLPVLGDRYGKVLEDGEFKLSCVGGAFFLNYFETHLPINPRSYPIILRSALVLLDGEAGENLRGIIGLFSSLAQGGGMHSEAKVPAKKHFADLMASDARVASAVDSALRTFEGSSGDPSSFDALHGLLEAQSYRLAYWRVAAEEINYRRFFDINTLAGIRIEIPEVFEAAHQLVFELLARGDVTGLRIDHIDGLWDPREYFLRLQHCYALLCGLEGVDRGLYLLIEKILDITRETLPADWPVHGTTGYEFANQVVQLFIEPASERRITRAYQRFTGLTDSFEDLVYEKKMLTMRISLSGEVLALARMLDELSEMHRHFRDLTRNTLASAIHEVIACFPVYRTYVTGEGVLSAEDEKVVLRAIVAARRRNPAVEKHVFDFLRNILLMRLPDTLSTAQREAHVRFVQKFQQTSGPVMAKGLEDTSFYIYNRLVALNEVGGDPGLFGIDIAEFHRLNAERCACTPHSMLSTSTHDTKRSEDVRMRLAVLSELPEIWDRTLARWSSLNRRHRTAIDNDFAPSRNEECLLYQTLLGTWPLQPFASAEERDAYAARIRQYMLKALKEAKINSSWTEPNETWEQSVEGFITRILDPAPRRSILPDLENLAARIAWPGAMNSLAQCVLKCTLPGMPDFYQGTEIWDFSLVDPDNRRPVDYDLRRHLMASLEGASPADLLADWRSGRIKLFFIQTLLRFRRDHDAFFRDAGYHPIDVSGSLSRHIIAFAREGQGSSLVVAVPRFLARFDFPATAHIWQDTSLPSQGAGVWRDLLTGAEVPGALSAWPLADLFAVVPFAVLYRGS